MKIVAKTKLSPEETVKRAVEFFGPGGLGLEVKEHNPDCAYFVGGGGGVNITTCVEGKKTSVELESREWDYQVRSSLVRFADSSLEVHPENENTKLIFNQAKLL